MCFFYLTFVNFIVLRLWKETLPESNFETVGDFTRIEPQVRHWTWRLHLGWGVFFWWTNEIPSKLVQDSNYILDIFNFKFEVPLQTLQNPGTLSYFESHGILDITWYNYIVPLLTRRVWATPWRFFVAMLLRFFFNWWGYTFNGLNDQFWNPADHWCE